MIVVFTIKKHKRGFLVVPDFFAGEKGEKGEEDS